MNRRDFLVTAGAFASVTALSGAKWPNHRRLEIRKAVKLGMIESEGSLADRFSMAKSAGFAGVELDSPSQLETGEVLDAKRATGILVPGVVNSVHWAKPLNHPDAGVRAEGLAGLEQAIRDANACCDREAGIKPTVLLVPAVVNKEMPYEDARQLSMQAISRVLPLASELRVAIAIENVWNEFLLSPIEAAHYVDDLNAIAHERVVGWYFDVGNIWRYGWPEHWISTLGDRIMRIDVKGYSRAKSDKEGRWAGFGVEIDEGDLDWAAVRQALDKVGYRGWATAEVRGGGKDRLADISQRMDTVLGLNE